jgi:formylmethanofuran dehydrogenase subunit E
MRRPNIHWLQLFEMQIAILLAVLSGTMLLAQASPKPAEGEFYPEWAATATYNRPLWVRDTDSAIGRRNLQSKQLTLRDAAAVHGHLCDGLVISWVELGAALRQLFPDGIVDRTDARVVSKNGPCWADAAAWTTGARVNHGTLILDNSVGDGFIVQRVSTGTTVRVRLRKGVYPEDLAELERSIRKRRAQNEQVPPEDVDRFESGAGAFSRKLLNTPPADVLQIEYLVDFEFPGSSPNLIAPRSDVINRDLPRVACPARKTAGAAAPGPWLSGVLDARPD